MGMQSCWKPGFVSLFLAIALAPTASAQAPSEDRYHIYQLNNISKTNAIKILKTLNYQVVVDIDKTTVPASERPVIVALPDSVTTSLVGPLKLEGTNTLQPPAVGVPQQRLLIVWRELASLESLLSLLVDKIDVPARQILIEALVLELDRDRFKDLGISFSGSKDGQEFSLPANSLEPFTFLFKRPSANAPFELSVTVAALVRDGTAEILSQPSVLTLDGRQARIRVGDRIPYTEVTSSTLANTEQIISATQWAEVGIALNLRPRATEDGSAITMQVETLISSGGNTTALTNAVLGPPISTREVQTIVRVANDTPFIIGGLISRNETDQRSGIPGLSKIPWLGKLFRKRNQTRQQKEVIIVITPHVLPLADPTFSYSIPKDSDLLNNFDLTLFRNTYRVRSDDILDTGFIRDSELYHDLRDAADLWAQDFERWAEESGGPPVVAEDRLGLVRQMRQAVEEQPDFLSTSLMGAPHPAIELLPGLFEGRVPGEKILVQRMLLGIIEKLEYGRHVDPKKIVFFEAHNSGQSIEQPILEISELHPRMRGLGGDCRTLSLTFKTDLTTVEVEGVTVNFDPPIAVVDTSLILGDDAAYLQELRASNLRSDSGGWQQLAILLNDCYELRSQSTLRMLQNVLALKRLIELNPSLPLTLEGFHVGRRLLFPTVESLRSARHDIDRKTAQLFYETLDYYLAFEQVFGLSYKSVSEYVTRRSASPQPAVPLAPPTPVPPPSTPPPPDPPPSPSR